MDMNYDQASKFQPNSPKVLLVCVYYYTSNIHFVQVRTPISSS